MKRSIAELREVTSGTLWSTERRDPPHVFLLEYTWASRFPAASFLLGSAAAALSGPAFLAACGGSKDSGSGESTADTGAGGSTETAAASGSGDSLAKVRIASWPFYIEDDQNPTDAATIANFVKATGREVDYKLAIDDNNSFTTKYQPLLEKGESIGFDVALPTSWMCARWIENGWVEEIPADLVPNKANLADSLANPSWDPGPQVLPPVCDWPGRYCVQPGQDRL